MFKSDEFECYRGKLARIDDRGGAILDKLNQFTDKFAQIELEPKWKSHGPILR